MRTRSFLIVGGLGLVLGVVLALTLLVPIATEPPADRPLLSTDIGGVQALHRRAEGQHEVLRRTGDDSNQIWVLEWSDVAGITHTWPVSTDRVRAALRVLATTTDESGPAPTGTPPDPAWPRLVLVTETTDGRAERELVFEPGSLGGRSRVWVDGRPRTIPSETAEAFGRQSLTAWLDRRLLPPPPAPPEGGARAGVQRLTLEAETGAGRSRLSLMRGPRGWSIAEPLIAPASADRVSEALRAVQQLEWTRIAVGVEASEAGLDRPSAVLTLTGAGGRTHRATIGAAVPGRGTVFARLEHAGGASLLVETPREGLERLPLDPAAYADRRATDVGAADVRAVRLRWLRDKPGPDASPLDTLNAPPDLALSRTLEGWRLHDAPADGETRAAAALLLQCLTTAEAIRVSTARPTGAGAIAAVELAGTDGLAIAAAELWLSQDAVIVRTGELWRSFDPQPLGPMLQWLANHRASE